MSNQRYDVSRAASPVSEFDDIVALEERVAPEDSIGLCLSGGGFRAMLFHVGAILRLNEAKLLPKLGRVSSVSGGSITAAVLGLHWKKLHFQEGVASNLDELYESDGSPRGCRRRFFSVSTCAVAIHAPSQGS